MTLYTTLIVASVLLGLFAYYLSRRSRKGSFLLLGISLMFILAKVAFHLEPVWEAGIVKWGPYVHLQKFVLYPVGVVFLCTACGHLPVLWNRIVIASMACLLLLFGAWENRWIAFPEVHGEERYVDAWNHFRQSTGYTCAPAAAMSALAYFDIRISEREMAAYCITSSGGSGVFSTYRGLYFATRDRGIEVELDNFAPQDLFEEGTVWVAGTNAGFHAICLVGMGDGKVRVHDPGLPTSKVWEMEKVAKYYVPPAVKIFRLPDKEVALGSNS